MDSDMVKENFFIKMVACMMEIGFKTKCKDMENCIINQVLFFLCQVK